MGEPTKVPARILLQDGYEQAKRFAEWLEAQLTQASGHASRRFDLFVTRIRSAAEVSAVVIRDLKDRRSVDALAASLVSWVGRQPVKGRSLTVTIGEKNDLAVEIDSKTDEVTLANILAALFSGARDLDSYDAASTDRDARIIRSILFDHMRRTPGMVVGATTVPVTIYLSDEAGYEVVEEAVDKLLADAGGDVDERGEPIFGSFFRSLQATFRRLATTPEGKEVAKVAAHAAEARLVQAQDATNTATLAGGLSQVLESLQNTTNAVIRIGALLIVKVDSDVMVHQLTATQQLKLDHKPDLTMSPRDILTALALDANNAIAALQPSDIPSTAGRIDGADSG
jgi:hypothetical protein